MPFPAVSALNPAPAGADSVPDYRPTAGTHDEMLAEDGSLRPHWRGFGRYLAHCSPEELQTRAAAMQRLLRDHGVTYNVYDDALGTRRPWSLDLLPFLIAEAEWRELSAGLDQRGRLLNALLADLYGPQSVLAAGLLPPRLLHANPGYLRPALGILPAGGCWLAGLACDLVRGSDGRWQVLSDRAERPAGHGYALENRVILSNVFSEAFHDARVRRLAGHFDRLRERLQGLAPNNRHGRPGIVLLTPGPHHETYYEHAFLARHLGFPLVEGADLTTRDRHLHLKTLEGLHRIDVLVRHVDDRWCDPLELQAESLLGVAGLAEAWRTGNVALANGLGAGLVDTPALHPFLPALCRHLLGEELRLASVDTLWCAQPEALARVCAEPGRWVVKPAFARAGRDPVFLADLDSVALNRQLEQLHAEPHAWVAQEVLALSTTPTWTGDHIEPRPLVWRTFTVADGDRYEAMPGGLARVSPESGRWLITLRSGGISKDTWVIADDENAPLDAARPAITVPLRPARPPSGVPSRAADHLFWFGRYAERLEQTARLLRAVLQRLHGETAETEQRELAACAALTGELDLPEGGIEAQLPELLDDPSRMGSLPDLVQRLLFNASAARDRLSDDTWRLVHRIERDARMPAGPFQAGAAQAMLDTLILDLAAVSGMQQENMTRGHGWRFMEIGRRLERATSIARLARTAARLAASDDAVLVPLLEVCDSSMTYRRLHFARPALLPVLDLLLLNEGNPRSVARQFAVIGRQCAQLPAGLHRDLPAAERREADTLRSDLAALNLDALARRPEEAPAAIDAFCTRFIDGLERLSDLLTEHYFSHAASRGEGRG
jgi:uncharacterized circularly permuted ATP-grasp superfamily protein/uncharacterized alpha-E superfamily protein